MKYILTILIALTLCSCYEQEDFYSSTTDYKDVVEAKETVQDSTLIITNVDPSEGEVKIYNKETETITTFITLSKYTIHTLLWKIIGIITGIVFMLIITIEY